MYSVSHSTGGPVRREGPNTLVPSDGPGVSKRDQRDERCRRTHSASSSLRPCPNAPSITPGGHVTDRQSSNRPHSTVDALWIQSISAMHGEQRNQVLPTFSRTNRSLRRRRSDTNHPVFPLSQSVRRRGDRMVGCTGPRRSTYNP